MRRRPHTDFRHTFEIQLGKDRVLFQRLGQSTGTRIADGISYNIHRSAESHHPHSNSHTLISDILERFSWVKIVFCFKDSASAQPPESPIEFSKICTSQLNLVKQPHTDFRHTGEIQLGKDCVLL